MAVALKKHSCKFICDKNCDSYIGATKDCCYNGYKSDRNSHFSLHFGNTTGIFRITSIISCLSIFVVLNKSLNVKNNYMYLNSHYVYCTDENLKVNCFGQNRPYTSVSYIPKCLHKHWTYEGTLFSNFKHFPLFLRDSILNIGKRNASSKTGKIVIGGEKESWEMLIDYEKLSPLERKIHERHRNAVKVK